MLSRLLLVLALVLTPGVALAAPLQDQQRPTDPRYGISPGADILWLPEAELMQELDLYQSMGFGWIRLDFDWHSIQDRRGRYSWTATDRVVQAARERGLRVLAMPAYTPRWAAVVDDPHSRPADMSAFARFVGAAVKRYRPLGIHDWEIWNEPNSRLFWLPRPDARAYARMLALTSRRIRVNDPEATIIAGALAPASTARNGSQISPIDFLRELYSADASPEFDALSVHPYTYPLRPDHPDSAWNTNFNLAKLSVAMRKSPLMAKSRSPLVAG